jgi:hypothetical protein
MHLRDSHPVDFPKANERVSAGAQVIATAGAPEGPPAARRFDQNEQPTLSVAPDARILL